MKPIILITSYHVGKEEVNPGRVRGKEEQDLSICTWDYINAVAISGGIPLVLPNIGEEDDISEITALADGILFSGGEDVHPRYFNEEIIADNLKICDRRDSFELRLAERIFPLEMPILGICRGMQLLNVAAGGSLYQDIRLQYETAIRHSNPKSGKSEIIHGIKLLEGTKLYDIYRKEVRGVNSFHHQAVKGLAPCLKASAYSEDGLLEAYEMEGRRFFMGVQWHPEMLFEKYNEELAIFKAFVENAKIYKDSKC